MVVLSIRLSKLFLSRNSTFQTCLTNYRTMAQGLTREEVKSLCAKPRDGTKEFFFQETTLLRIKDPRKSLPFYTGVLAMTLLKDNHFPEMKFSLYLMGYENPADIPTDEDEREVWGMTRRAPLTLVHNWGTESDDLQYHNGNIGVHVPDVDAACAKFEEQGVDCFKRPQNSTKKGAFIRDPDGYLIEIFKATSI